MKTYRNPVQRGFFPDPSVIRVGDDYYMANSSFQYFPAIPISHSRDMVHWHIIGHAVVNSDWLDLSAIPDSHGIWAPDISYYNGTYYIFATLRLTGDGKRGKPVLRRQLVVTSKKPEGPYSQPHWLEVDDIDPSHFIDDDGTHYMAIAAGIKLIRLSDDCTRLAGPLTTVWAGTGDRCPEGPHVLKKDGWYYGMLAEGGTGYSHGIVAARSKKLFGPYEESPYNPVLRQKDPQAPIQRSGHGKLVQAQDGSWWVYYLCGRMNGGRYTTLGRETSLDPVYFTKDGWFTVNGGLGPSSEQKCPDLEEYTFTKKEKEDFDDNKIPLEWEFVRNPANGDWSLSDRHGWFRIWTGDGCLDELRAKNTLVRRETELKYEAETAVDFKPSRDGEQAGLVCYYSTATYIRWCVCWEKSRKLQLVVNRGEGEEVEAELTNIPEGVVYLKVQVEGQRRTFSYSIDNNVWYTGGTVYPCTFLCDEGVPADRKRHTGTMVGLYANNGGCGSRIPADFDYFSMHTEE